MRWAPWFIDTDMTAVLNEQTKTAVLNNIPLKTFGKVEDIAHAALFLASPAARYITGQVLAVDGGMVMAYEQFERRLRAIFSHVKIVEESGLDAVGGVA